MRHGVKTRKLGRRREHRQALLANLAAALITHRRITTTLPKAKLMLPFVDKLASLAKRGDLSARRLAASRLRDPAALATLFDTHAQHWALRTSGFSRWVRLGPRQGDGAELAAVELLVPAVGSERESKETKASGSKGSAKSRTARPAKARAKAAAGA
jgi:large subunit ribosomal protein L17